MVNMRATQSLRGFVAVCERHRPLGLRRPHARGRAVEKIVTWWDSAMRRHKLPDLAAERGVNANFHADRVTQFYLEHPWLGENVAMTLAVEFALCWLLVYFGLLGEAW